MIEFNKAPHVGTEEKYISQAIEKGKLCGDGPFTRKCSEWMKEQFRINHVFLTTSCTHSLEMAALLCNIQEGDEIIMPSYTFVSTADAFVQRGAKIVFTDIRPDTMNIDERLIADAITNKTKAIVPVHYAGVACDMDIIMSIARDNNLKVVEDAAQCFDSYYKDIPLGTIGDFGCLSFHETKNLTMGEGGALMFSSDDWQEQAEIIREKGTNRSKFFRGQIDKYTWVGYGSSYLPSDMNAAYLWAQLENYRLIQDDRMNTWNFYDSRLKPLADKNLIEQPYIPDYARHNAHMYYLKLKDLDTRTDFISYLSDKGIMSVFHYIPLHTSPAGRAFGRFHGEDIYTTRESERLVRLPLYYGLGQEEKEYIVNTIYQFFKNKGLE